MTNVRYLKIDADLDISRKSDIKRDLSLVGRFGAGAVTILDLSEVDFADSTFVNALLALHADMKDIAGSGLCIVASAQIKRLLKITSLDRMIPVFDRVSAARDFAFSIESTSAAHESSLGEAGPSPTRKAIAAGDIM